jgi:hypothetical protein
MAAAVSGLISGTAIQQGHGDPTNAAPGQADSVKNAPKVHGCAGQNDCKGIGGCKTEAHDCKFKNSCKGKGGCEVTDKDIKAWEQKQKDDAAKAATQAPGKDSSTQAKP